MGAVVGDRNARTRTVAASVDGRAAKAAAAVEQERDRARRG
jgi:hypothetical protein